MLFTFKKLPELLKDHIQYKQNIKNYKIEDSIEGWADALGVLMSSFFIKPVKGFEEYQKCNIVFDYSGIRAAGVMLGSGVGKAPGPEPLRKGLEKIRTLLQRCIDDNQKKLRPIDAYDIIMHSI